jgi:hypothetical protein
MFIAFHIKVFNLSDLSFRAKKHTFSLAIYIYTDIYVLCYILDVYLSFEYTVYAYFIIPKNIRLIVEWSPQNDKKQ